MSLDRYSSARRGLTALVLFLVVAVLIAACGSSSSGTTTGTSAAAAGGTGNGGTADSTARYQARLNLAKCARAHGINIPDPTPNGGGGGFGRILQQYSQAQITSALQACKQYTAQAFPRLNLSPAQQAQFRQQFVKYAECMRSHGINIPDPTTTAGGGFGLRRALGSVDRNSPAFQSAQQACQGLRPQFGGRGGGPGA